VVNVGFAGLFAFFLFSTLERIPEDVNAPAVGSPAPDFALPDQQGRETRLSDLRGSPVVLVFYRGHW
jgi:cytochrome oxidase Cu insertion factor (SCO1/SenC/PrrC family)